MVDDRRLRSSPPSLPALVTRERRAAQLLRLERPGARGLGEALDLGVELVDRARVAAAHDRDDEPLRRSARRRRGRSGRGRRSRRPRARVQLGELLQRLRAPPSAPSARAASGRRAPKSHSSTQVTAGTSRCARAMCSAISAAHAAQAARGGPRGPSRGLPAAPRTSVLGDAALRPGACDGVEIDAELLGDPAHERGGAHLRAVGARTPRAGPLGRAVGSRSAAAVAADHDEHRADRDDVALARRGCSRRRRPPATGSRPSSCRSGSRRAGRPRRSPGPRRRASGRSRPRSGPRRGPAA